MVLHSVMLAEVQNILATQEFVLHFSYAAFAGSSGLIALHRAENSSYDATFQLLFRKTLVRLN